MNNERLEKHEKSREKACDARYHAHEIELALEVFYWTGDPFQYHEAIHHFESLVSEMAQFQHKFNEEKGD